MGNPLHTAKDLRRVAALSVSMDHAELLELAAGQIELLVAAQVHGTRPMSPMYDSPNHKGPIGVGPTEGCECCGCKRAVAEATNKRAEELARTMKAAMIEYYENIYYSIDTHEYVGVVVTYGDTSVKLPLWLAETICESCGYRVIRR